MFIKIFIQFWPFGKPDLEYAQVGCYAKEQHLGCACLFMAGCLQKTFVAHYYLQWGMTIQKIFQYKVMSHLVIMH